MSTCSNCGNVMGLHSSILQGCMCQYSMQAPPQRTWVGLTQDELNMIGDSMRTWNSWTITDVYFAIEAKLKEKNGYAKEKNR